MENVGVSHNYVAKQRAKSIVYFVICVIIALICLVPIYIMLTNATHSHAELIVTPVNWWFGDDLINNIKAIPTQYSDWSVLRAYRNSLIIAGCTTILTVFFSAATAYGLTVYNFKIRDGAYTVILAVMMIPIQVTSTGFVQFMVGTLGLADSYIPLIVPSIAAPAVVFYMRQYMKSSFPLEIVEAARIDGCNEFRTFVNISIPMLRPAIAVQAIFAFVQNWNNYYTQNMILLSNSKRFTMPMMLQKVVNVDKNINMGARYSAVMLSIIPIVVIYLCLSHFIIGGVTAGGVKE